MRNVTASYLILLVCVAVCFFCGTAACQAQGPGMAIGPGGGGPGVGPAGRHRGFYSGGWSGRDSYYSVYALYRDGFMPLPPYFAVHPPVYYSYPVPRPYGYSPFAYPGWVPTPEVLSPPQPATIVNPYVAPPTPPADEAPAEQSPAEGASARTASVPKVIYNPYVTQSLTAVHPASH